MPVLGEQALWCYGKPYFSKAKKWGISEAFAQPGYPTAMSVLNWFPGDNHEYISRVSDLLGKYLL
jgi:hypothetical protein